MPLFHCAEMNMCFGYESLIPQCAARFTGAQTAIYERTVRNSSSTLRRDFRWTPPNFFSCGPYHKKFHSRHLHPETSSTTAHSSPFSPSPSLVGSHAPQLPRPFLSFHRWRGLQEDTAVAAAHGGLSGALLLSPFSLPLPWRHGGLGDVGLEVAAVRSKLRPVLRRRFALGLAGVARSSPAWSGRCGFGGACGQ